MSKFLIREDFHDVEMLVEDVGGGKRNRYIHGVYIQSNKMVKNGRIYPRGIMEPAVQTFIEDLVSKNRAIGELNHPSRLKVDPAEASHLITELYWDGDNVIGKARVLDKTPKGAILNGLLEGGVQMGVSTRGAGSVKNNSKGIPEVQGDFRLATVDAVIDPSAPDAFVNGLMESADWIYENGIFLQDSGRMIEESIKEIRSASSSKLEEAKLIVFERFLKALD